MEFSVRYEYTLTEMHYGTKSLEILPRFGTIWNFNKMDVRYIEVLLCWFFVKIDFLLRIDVF